MISSVSSASRVVHDSSARHECTSLIEIRKAGPGDVQQIPALFESVYGRTFESVFGDANPGVYSADILAGRISRGELTSIVAIAPDGRVVGHCALIKDNKEADFGRAALSVVHRDFRNMGCESRMLGAVIQEARARGLEGILSQGVTHHVFAQKTGQKFGFKRIGLQVGIMPDRRIYDGKHPAPGRRQSLAIGYLPLKDQRDITIYPPVHHRKFIEMLYRQAGLKRSPVSLAPADRPPLTGRALLKARMVARDVAQVTIDRYGVGIYRCVEELWRDMRARDIRYISMELPLASPHTATACREFERLGFFISGIMPHSPVGDALVLQYVHNAHVDYDDINVASETLAAIKSYVLDHDPHRAAHCPRELKGDEKKLAMDSQRL